MVGHHWQQILGINTCQDLATVDTIMETRLRINS
jgi:hypothetical protein